MVEFCASESLRFKFQVGTISLESSMVLVERSMLTSAPCHVSLWPW